MCFLSPQETLSSFLLPFLPHFSHSGPAVCVGSRWYRPPGNGTDLLCATHKVDSSTHHVTSTSAPLLNQPTKSIRLCFLRHGFSLSSPFLALLPSGWLHNLVSCFPPLHLWTLVCWGNYLWIYLLYWRTSKSTCLLLSSAASCRNVVWAQLIRYTIPQSLALCDSKLECQHWVSPTLWRLGGLQR